MAEAKSKKKMGRPSKYSEKIVAQICAELGKGKSLYTACNIVGINHDTAYEWLHKYKDFSERYARAKQESADFMAEDLLDISDDGTNDWMEVEYGRGQTKTVVDNEAIQRSKLRVETRKWLMAKMKPKKYGDKLDVTSDGEKLPTPIYGGASLKEKADD